MHLFLIIIIILILVFLSAYLLINVRIRTNPLYGKVPTIPPGNTFFGIYLDFLKCDCRLLEMIKKHTVDYGKIRLSFACWGRARLNIGEPKWIKYVLNSKNFIRGHFPGAEDIFIGVGDNGLIVVNGDKHKRLRKLASPAFKLTTIKKVIPIIEKCSKRMIDLFSTKCEESSDGEINVKEVLTKTTLDIIGLIAFGHDFKESLSFETDTFGSHMRDMLDLQLSIGCLLPYQLPFKMFIWKIMRYLPQTFYDIFKFNRTMTRARTAYKIHDLVDSLVSDKIFERQNSNWSHAKSKCLLDFIIEDSAHESPKEIHDLLMTFLIAGHETSTLGVTWALFLLAKNPSYLPRCREEALLFFQKPSSDIDWDSIKRLTWINAVVNETMRLYPAVPWIHRVSISDDVIDGHFVPANTDTLLINCEAQRHPDFWSNPNDFMPERFLDPDAVPWDAFMPFGDGPHKCIGYQLALTEINYLLAAILNKFHFSIDPNVDYYEYAIVTMQPKPQLKLLFKPY